MRFLIALISCIFVANAANNIKNDVTSKVEPSSLLERLFNDFRQFHQKIYHDKIELKNRFEIFKQNLKKIAQLKLREKGTAKYEVNQFSDLTEQEFAEQFLGHEVVQNIDIQTMPAAVMVQENGFPEEGVDWRLSDVVTPVKNQGACGSCWAFSVAANIESLWKIKTGQTVELSPQQLVDCDRNSFGCSGGYTNKAYDTVKRLGGLKNLQDYPYTARQNRGCLLGSAGSKPAAYINGSVVLPQDERRMAQYLFDHGPVSVLVNAKPWQFYSSGVEYLDAQDCNPQALNHAVLAVGFGTDERSQHPYWIIKNSWGTGWGEQGYMRLYRGANTCGVRQFPTSAYIF